MSQQRRHQQPTLPPSSSLPYSSSPLTSLPPSPHNEVPTNNPPSHPAQPSTRFPLLFQQDINNPNPLFSSLLPHWHQTRIPQSFRTPSPPPNVSSHPPAVEDDPRDGMEPYSTPIRGRTKAERRAHRKEKRKRKRRAREEARLQERAAKKARLQAEEDAKRRHLDEGIRRIFHCMDKEKIHLGDFMEHVFSADFYAKDLRYLNFFNSPSRVKKVLTSWVKLCGRKAAESVTEWAVDRVAEVTCREFRQVTESGVLRTSNEDISTEFGLGFSLPDTYTTLSTYCPHTLHILTDLATTTKQRQNATIKTTLKKHNLVTSAMIILLGARSQRNSYPKNVIGLWLYSIGTARQGFSVLSHLGISCNYTSLIGRAETGVVPRTSNSSAGNQDKTLDETVGVFGLEDDDSDEDVEEEEEEEDAEEAADAEEEADIGEGEEEDDAYESDEDSSTDTDNEGWESDTPLTRNTPGPIPSTEQSPFNQPALVQVPIQAAEGAPMSNAGEPSTKGMPATTEAPDSSPVHPLLSIENPAQSAEVPPVPADGASTEALSTLPDACTTPGHTASTSQNAALPTQSQSEVTGNDGFEAPVPTRRDGLLRQLSHACRMATWELAKLGLLAYVYDNINMVFKIAEQIIGRKDTQQNGTCATAFELYGTKPEDLSTAEALEYFVKAPALSLDDVILTKDENAQLNTHLENTVLRIIIQYGGDRFLRFLPHLQESALPTPLQIPIHKTTIHPLPSMEIDESSVQGNAEVLNTMFKETDSNYGKPVFAKNIKIIWGDQLSMAHVRSVKNTRIGHASPYMSYLNCTCGPGLFHYIISAAGFGLEIHWGDPHTWTKNPGSLVFHNTLLGRKPFVITSPPPYRTSRDLIFVSLYGRIFHCLEHVANISNLDEFAAQVSFDQLRLYAREILTRFADSDKAERLRSARAKEQIFGSENITQGDMVFENAVLFLRDALLLREFAYAIKAGDSGRVILCLRVLALSYRGSGRTKYAYETLVLLHNYTHVWSPRLRNSILMNWLLNPTGKPNGFVPVDLVQEHLNFWIKVIYKAHGSAASWEWLKGISPCVEILRRIATHINSGLGSHQGSKHSSPDLWNDISVIMKSLREQRVYEINPGRTIPGAKVEVINIVEKGLNLLPKSINDYNVEFQTWQRRHLRRPLIGDAAISIPTGTDKETDASHNPATPPCDSIPGMDSPPRMVSPPHIPTPGTSTPTPDDPSDVNENTDRADEGGTNEPRSIEVETQGYFDDELLTRETEEDVALDMD
ncbi:hypothetical protein NLI96_g67 [Meripilus lineatus]|uniref:DUF6589 domain-containing protein n=1 Tax=Meripilus lineatus TaxID=2056292 RepID=A0AAD5VHA1_9APHY|nr:hypothetical protein NLI96_g67 [Physisporinus lineatus]